jgi:hypothetical protein
MSFNKSIAAITLASSLLAATGSFAQEPANTIGCLHLSKQVASALEANQQSPNYKAAADEQSAGRQFCLSGVYTLGVAHYEKALNYLGQQLTKN